MTQRVKRGTSKAAAAERLVRFVEAYIANGENGTQAAIAIGVPERGAHVQASRWLKDVKVQKLLEKKRQELRARYALTTDRVVQELARVSYFNPKRLVDANGKPIPLHQLDDDTAAALSSVEISEVETRGRGKNKVVINRLVKGRPFNKPTALEKSIKILRLYDKPPPPPPDETGEQRMEDPRDTARRMAFLLAKGARADEKADPKPAPARRKKLPVAA